MSKIKITIISDTHTRHDLITNDLPGGDILLFAGDLMNSGYVEADLVKFCKWFESLDNYEFKVFIAGNHDRLFENKPDVAREIYTSYKNINYLQDEEMSIYFDGPNGEFPDGNIHIYGSPWQPWFYDWAFNLPKNGPGLASKWAAIPERTDILITHGPVFGVGALDTVAGRPNDHLGCELLAEHINTVARPKIHVCGHIHSGYGYHFDGQTHYFNASVLDEQYEYTQKPLTFDWDRETNEITFI
jgi:Icc-related predicted phosphoesterase